VTKFIKSENPSEKEQGVKKKGRSPFFSEKNVSIKEEKCVSLGLTEKREDWSKRGMEDEASSRRRRVHVKKIHHPFPQRGGSVGGADAPSFWEKKK